MNIKEFRIGNYAYHDGNLIQIELKHFEDMLLYPNEQRKYDGIPLTEDWMNKFGLLDEANKSFGKYKRVESYGGISIEFDKNGLQTHGRKIIRYVHTLQNIYLDIEDRYITLNS